MTWKHRSYNLQDRLKNYRQSDCSDPLVLSNLNSLIMDTVISHDMLNEDGQFKCLQPGICSAIYLLSIVPLKLI